MACWYARVMSEVEPTTTLHPRGDDSSAALPVLPQGLSCPGCDYDLGGSRVRVCSECGRAVERGDLVSFRKRRRADQMLRTASSRFLKLLALAPLMMGGGALLILLDIRAAALAAVLSVIMLAGSWGIGVVAARFAQPPHRTAIRVAWMVALPWMNGPWLVLPVFGVGMAAVLLLFVGGPRGHSSMDFYGVLLVLPFMVIWGIIAIVLLVKALTTYFGGVREFGVRRDVMKSVAEHAVVVVCLFSLVFGIAGVVRVLEAL